MKDFTTINNQAYAEHLALRYELMTSTRIANCIVVSIIAIISLVNYLRYIAG